MCPSVGEVHSVTSSPSQLNVSHWSLVGSTVRGRLTRGNMISELSYFLKKAWIFGHGWREGCLIFWGGGDFFEAKRRTASFFKRSFSLVVCVAFYEIGQNQNLDRASSSGSVILRQVCLRSHSFKTSWHPVNYSFSISYIIINHHIWGLFAHILLLISFVDGLGQFFQILSPNLFLTFWAGMNSL